MKTLHAKSTCCGARIYRFGGRRRQCQACGRTWRIRRKKRGRTPRRLPPAFVKRIVLGQGTLQVQARRYGLTPQGLSYHFRQELRRCLRRPPGRLIPSGDLVLLLDGLWFRFRQRPWVLYLMALKPCGADYAIFLDPVLCAGRENLLIWSALIEGIPGEIRRRIRGLVTDNLRGMKSLAHQYGWVLQLCQFHLISQLQGRRGRNKKTLTGRSIRERLYQLTRQALHVPDGPILQRTVKRLQLTVEQPLPARKMRMAVREFLRDLDHYRAYQTAPELRLPTTTNTVECMGHIIRDRLRRARHLRTPSALQAWVTGLLRVRSQVTCNGKHFQPNSFV